MLESEPPAGPSSLRVFLAIAFLIFVWSLNYIVGKIALRELPALALGSFRLLVAGIVSLPALFLPSAGKGKATTYLYYRPAQPVNPTELTDRWNAIGISSPKTSFRMGLVIECRLHAGEKQGLYLDGQVMGTFFSPKVRAPGR